MNKLKIDDKIKVKSKQIKVSAVGIVETSSQLQTEQAERLSFWKDAINTIKNETFLNIEQAVDRVIDITATKMPSIASNKSSQEFIKEILMDNEELLETLKSNLTFR